MTVDERLVERKKLLMRAFPRVDLFEIGRRLDIPYFEGFSSGWEIDEDEASYEIAFKMDDKELKRVFEEFKPRGWVVFRGRYYMLERGRLFLEGSWKKIHYGILRIIGGYGGDGVAVLKALIKSGGVADLEELRRRIKVDYLYDILEDLESLGVVVTSYKGDKYHEWMILEEALPIVESELEMRATRVPKPRMVPPEGKVDYLLEEKQRIGEMDEELESYLSDLLKHRIEGTIEFGRSFSIGALASYLRELFGSVLYFDSLLSITQQYGLANVEIVHEHGKTGRRTGWSLALFGEPGTGKSFSTRDMILGRPGAKISQHGIPGRNRYCGGMTPARFIRIGEAYAERTFNFIIPEFNDFFKYKGMVEPLKLAMEQGEIKYETYREIIGPYRFTSFFAVNYNVSVLGRGYTVTIQDPNFNAIEDRMLCRLHRLTKKRFTEIAESQMRVALGEVDIEKGAQPIQDHLTLVYAIETGHPLVKGRFPYKPVMITPRVYELIGRAREAILEAIPDKTVKFSARLEDRALRFASAASLMEYFLSDMDYITIGEETLKYAVQLYVEEASVRSRETFKPEEVLKKIFKE